MWMEGEEDNNIERIGGWTDGSLPIHDSPVENQHICSESTMNTASPILAYELKLL